MRKIKSLMIGLGFVVTLAGCGPHAVYFKTAPVAGIVTCEGVPAPGVMVIFSPQAGKGRTAAEPGKAAMGMTDLSGKFVLSTYEKLDGAVVGSHQVTFSIAEPAENPDLATSKKLLKPFLHESREIEVVAGKNELTIDLRK